jgi:hypothetical protein
MVNENVVFTICNELIYSVQQLAIRQVRAVKNKRREREQKPPV